LFLYSAAISGGILTATKIISEGIVKLLIDRSRTKYLKRIDETTELNRKMHDRLIDIEVDLKEKRLPSGNVIKRLFYNASRLNKYSEGIYENAEELVNFIYALPVDNSVISEEYLDIKDKFEKHRNTILKKVDSLLK
jgi:hypothetical protein